MNKPYVSGRYTDGKGVTLLAEELLILNELLNCVEL